MDDIRNPIPYRPPGQSPSAVPAPGMGDPPIPMPPVGGMSSGGNLPVPAPPPAGPCTWEVDTSCDPRWPSYPLPVQQRAVQLATEIMWAFSGHRFGLCELTIRPCRQPIRCGRAGFSWGGYGPYGSNDLLNPYVGADGLWRNGGCGGCAGECGCSKLCKIALDGPIYKVTEILTQGGVVPDTAWVVYNATAIPQIVRTDGGCWLDCQDLSQPDNAAEALAVTYLKGTPVPAAGRAAAGILASEIAKSCTAQACRLPTRVSQMVREGLTFNMIDPLAMFKQGRVGIPEIDMWLASVNPASIVRPMGVFSPDINRGSQVSQSNPYPWRP